MREKRFCNHCNVNDVCHLYNSLAVVFLRCWCIVAKNVGPILSPLKAFLSGRLLDSDMGGSFNSTNLAYLSRLYVIRLTICTIASLLGGLRRTFDSHRIWNSYKISNVNEWIIKASCGVLHTGNAEEKRKKKQPEYMYKKHSRKFEGSVKFANSKIASRRRIVTRDNRREKSCSGESRKWLIEVSAVVKEYLRLHKHYRTRGYCSFQPLQ